jgi:hypothetical protein
LYLYFNNYITCLIQFRFFMIFQAKFFKQISLMISLVLLCSCFSIAQVAICGSGNTASGPGGTICYSVGQPYIINASGSTGHSNGGIQQAFFVYTIGIPEHNSLGFEVSVFPNPATTTATIILKDFKSGSWEYILTRTNGLQVDHQIIEGNQKEISFQDLSAGVYILDVHFNGNPVESFKIVKQ